MRGGLVPLLILALVLPGCVTESPALEVVPAVEVAGVDAEGFAPVLFSGVKFQELDLGVHDGLRLHADVYLPDGAKEEGAPEKFPAILLLSPYWGAGTGGEPVGYMPYDFLVQRLLPRGYAVVFGDLAGNGGSSGCWDFMGPVERASAVAMVEAIAEQEWSDGKVGMMGLSYDGMTQIMAASDQAPHLTTVVPAAPLTHAYAGLRQNGVHYGGGWHATMTAYEASSLTPRVPFFPPVPNPERTQGWIETLRSTPACMADNHRGDSPFNEYTDYYAARDFRPLGSEVKASVFYIQGFLDGAVKPDNFGEWFHNVPTLKKAWLGHWFHQYPTANNGGRDDMYLTLHRWFDHTLKGIDNGIDREPMVDVQDSQGRWRREAAWPPADVNATTLYLGDGELLPQPAGEAQMQSVGGPGALPAHVMRRSMGDLTFSRELEHGIHIAGSPRVNLTLTSDRPAGMVVVRLWDATDERMITQGAFNLMLRDGLDRATPVPANQPIAIGFDLYPTDFAVPAGHELALQVLTQDPYRWFDPDASGAILKVEVGGEGSFLTLPLVERSDADVFLVSCGRALKDHVDGCYKKLKDQGVKSD